MTLKKIVYFGPNIKGSTTEKRINSLKDLKFNVNTLDSCNFYRLRSSIFKALQIRMGIGPIYKKVLSKILKEIIFFEPEYLIIETAILFNVRTLTKLKKNNPKLKIIFLTVDSIKNKTFQRPFFLKSLHLYDFIITTKPTDIKIYKKYFSKNLILSHQGVDEKNFLNYNLKPYEGYLKSEVVFIGDYGKKRANAIKFLIQNNVPIKIFGFNWSKDKFFKSYFFGPVMEDNYYKVLNNSKIGLGFLNNEVGDEYTTRSLEIPASGSLLLAEKTRYHKKLFKENEEAVFFRNHNDLLEKINYYLSNNKKREKIARSGKKKIQKLNLTWKSNLKKIFLSIKNKTNLI